MGGGVGERAGAATKDTAIKTAAARPARSAIRRRRARRSTRSGSPPAATGTTRPPPSARRGSSPRASPASRRRRPAPERSEEHTSELQSLMRISYAGFCLKKKKVTYHRLSQRKEQATHTNHY